MRLPITFLHTFSRNYLQSTRLFKLNLAALCGQLQTVRHQYNSARDGDVSDDELLSETSESSDPYYNDDVKFCPTFRQISFHCKSLRYDKIMRAGLNITRAALDEAFFSSQLRLNGLKLVKKGVSVSEGDRLDMVLSDVNNPSGKRVRVLDIARIKQESFKVSVRCWRSKVPFSDYKDGL